MIPFDIKMTSFESTESTRKLIEPDRNQDATHPFSWIPLFHIKQKSLEAQRWTEILIIKPNNTNLEILTTATETCTIYQTYIIGSKRDGINFETK